MSKARELKAVAAARGLRPIHLAPPGLAREGTPAVEVATAAASAQRPRATSQRRPYRVDVLLTAEAGALLEALRLHLRQTNGKPAKYPAVIERALAELARLERLGPL